MSKRSRGAGKQPESKKPSSERRVFRRRKGKAAALAIPEQDLMRSGRRGKVRDISPSGFAIVRSHPPRVNEWLMVQLENAVHHIKIVLRVRVCHVQPTADGMCAVGCALESRRLTPRELDALSVIEEVTCSTAGDD
jgi:hypothetical protein